MLRAAVVSMVKRLCHVAPWLLAALVTAAGGSGCEGDLRAQGEDDTPDASALGRVQDAGNASAIAVADAFTLDAGADAFCERGETVKGFEDEVLGLSSCRGSGLTLRTSASSCRTSVPEFTFSVPGNYDEDSLAATLGCRANGDCTERPNGYCEWIPDAQVPATRCTYACATDADCAASQVCDCQAHVGRCVPADCRSSDDCGGGPCIRFMDPSLCAGGYLGAGVYYGCHGPDDGCLTSDGCGEGEVCSAWDLLEGKVRRRCQAVPQCVQ